VGKTEGDKKKEEIL